MAKGKKKSTKDSRPRSYYELSEVVQKIDDGRYLIRENAKQSAYQDFGWEISDIKKFYGRLKLRHFYKTDNSKNIPGVVVDAYKAHLYGEDVYTHFYINDDLNILVINSFHRQ